MVKGECMRVASRHGVWLTLIWVFTATAAAAQKIHQVTANPDLTFSPAELTISAGDTVTWTNNGGLHNVRADDGGFRCADGCDGDGGDGAPSEVAWSFSLTFDDPGTNPYYCEVHGAPGGVGMSGVVTVEAVDDDDGGDDGDGDDGDDGDGDEGGGGGSGGGDDGDDGADDPDGDQGDDGDPDGSSDPGGGESERPPPPPTRFVSGFEVAGFDDWDLRSCSSCQLQTGSLAEAGAVASTRSFSSDSEGEHVAWLVGATETDLDLYLKRWTGTEWRSVAGAAGASATEAIRVSAAPGRYRWEVRSADGASSFALLFGVRGREDSSRLEQTSDARWKGSLGVSPVYIRGSGEIDYLVDQLPFPARAYEVGFMIQPLAGLALEGRRQALLMLRDGSKPLLRLKIRRARSKPGVRLSAAVKTDSGWSPRGSTFLRFDRWKRITITWRAASAPGAGDGLVEMRRGATLPWRIDSLENHAQRVTEIWFGMVTRGGERTEGRLFLDDFVSEWSF